MAQAVSVGVLSPQEIPNKIAAAQKPKDDCVKPKIPMPTDSINIEKISTGTRPYKSEDLLAKTRTNNEAIV